MVRISWIDIVLVILAVLGPYLYRQLYDYLFSSTTAERSLEREVERETQIRVQKMYDMMEGFAGLAGTVYPGDITRHLQSMESYFPNYRHTIRSRILREQYQQRVGPSFPVDPAGFRLSTSPIRVRWDKNLDDYHSDTMTKVITNNNNNNNDNDNDNDQITNIEKYPGSPAFARFLLRPQDSHYLWELHSDIYNLLHNFMFHRDDNGANKDTRLKTTDVRISHGDGFSGLLSHLSSFAVSTRSGERKRIILIDPPNKHIGEYEQARQTFEELLTNYSQATIMLWLPILEHCQESLKLISNLKDSIRAKQKEATNNEEKRLDNVFDISWTLASLTVSQSCLLGSSMFVVNPPKSFHSDMEEVLPFLAKILSEDCGKFSLTVGP